MFLKTSAVVVGTDQDSDKKQALLSPTHDTSNQDTLECEQNVAYSEPVAGVGIDEIDTHSNDHQGCNTCKGQEGGAVVPNKDMIKIFDIVNDEQLIK